MKKPNANPFLCGICWAESCWGCELNGLREEKEEEENEENEEEA